MSVDDPRPCRCGHTFAQHMTQAGRRGPMVLSRCQMFACDCRRYAGQGPAASP